MNKNKNILTIIAVVFLFMAMAEGLPYGFFQFLRFVVCGVTAYLAFLAHKFNRRLYFKIFIGIAILFNPIIPFYLSRGPWVIIDIIVGVFLIVSIFRFKLARNQASKDTPEIIPSPCNSAYKKYQKNTIEPGNIMAERNLKGIELEKIGDLEGAKSLYEQNVKDGFNGLHPYERLIIIYHKQKEHSKELKILEMATQLFPEENRFKRRLLRTKGLL